MTQHTPGPWITKYSPHQIEIFAPESSHVVTQIFLPVANYTQDEANARLIAASPETTAALVELLRVVREVMEPELDLYAKHHDDAHYWQNDEVNKAINTADAAIAKATGE